MSDFTEKHFEEITTIEAAIEWGLPDRSEVDASPDGPCDYCGVDHGRLWGGHLDCWGEATDAYCDTCAIKKAESERFICRQYETNTSP